MFKHYKIIIISFILIQLLWLGFSALSYRSCVGYKTNLNQSCGTDEVCTYFGAIYKCNLTVGAPGPMFYYASDPLIGSPESGLIVQGILFNITFYLLFFKFILILVERLKKASCVFSYAAIMLVGFVLMIIAANVLSFIFQWALKLTGFYTHFAGGPVRNLTILNDILYNLFYPTSVGSIGLFIAFIVASIFVYLVLVLIWDKTFYLNRTKLIIGLVLFVLSSIYILQFGSYMTEGIVDVNCLIQTSSMCDG